MFTLLAFVLLILPMLSAINVNVTEKSAQDVIIKGLDKPAIFNLEITNNEKIDEFYFYNLLGFTLEPKEKVTINRDETKDVQLIIYPRTDLDINNYYTLQYFIRGNDNSEQAEKITMKVVELKNAFEVGAAEIDPLSNSLNIYIYNKENTNFEDLNVKFSSKFFSLEEKFNLNANSKKEFNIELKKEDFDQLIAGFYTLTAEITFQELTEKTEGIIKFVEKDIVASEEKDSGIIISTVTIQKKNNGNTISTAETVIQKNIVSRLFTSFSPEPDAVERKGANVFYTWNKELKPGEVLEIKVTTNWLYPLLLIIFIVAIIILVKRYSTTDVTLRKKVSYVKAKGGEFALKVSLFVSSKSYVERINIIDRLPPLMKVYERFGGEQPARVDENHRIIEWDFEKLEAGEIRTLSYIIYSKNVGVMGKFALPSATAIYQKDGKVKEATSNKAFFVAEQRTRDVEYY